MKTLTLDAETKDPYIGEGLGAGWCYPGDKFKVLGFSVKFNDEVTRYVMPTELPEIQADYVIMHNASYDLGCLRKLDIPIRDLDVIDTEVMGRLFDSSLMSYALDNLAKKYLNHKKDNEALVEAIREAELVPYTQKHHTLLTRYCKTDDEEVKAELRKEIDKSDKLWEGRALKWAKENMDVMQEHCYSAVEQYANMDVDLTYQLFQYYLNNCESRGWDKEEFLALTLKYSNVSKITCSYRERGVRVDLKRCRQVVKELRPKIAEKYNELYKMAGEEFNTSSTDDCIRVFRKVVGRTDYSKFDSKGNLYKEKAYLKMAEKIAKWEDKDVEEVYSDLKNKGMPRVGKTYLEKEGHPLALALMEARQYKFVNDTFIQKILDMQVWTLNLTQEEVDNMDYGMIYPELHLLRASTGRFSASCPNIQNQPSRHKYLAPLVRSIYVAFPGEKIYSLDYQNQEGRLVLHYAIKLNLTGSKEWQDRFKEDPAFDMHTFIGEIIEKDRNTSKTVNHALTYSMGRAKTAVSLKLPTDTYINHKGEECLTCGPETVDILDKFHSAVPYIKELDEICKSTIKTRGYLITLGGRRVSADRAIWRNGEKISFDYKALNKLIQSSAANQTIEAMIQAYEANIPILFPVHDQFLISGEKNHAIALQNIMESAILLEIPVIVDVDLEGGFRWSEAGH